MHDQKDSHSKAAGAYGATSTAHSTDQRSLEGQILLKAAQKLEALANRLSKEEKVSREEIGEIMEYNQKLWMLFANDAGANESPLPQDVKNNIVSLALFTFKRTTDFLIETRPEQLSALIEINRNIASGLMKRQEAPAAPPSPAGKTAAYKTDGKNSSSASSKTPPAKGSTDSLI